MNGPLTWVNPLIWVTLRHDSTAELHHRSNRRQYQILGEYDDLDSGQPMSFLN